TVPVILFLVLINYILNPFSFFFHHYGDHTDLHSFPTRRSSDLFAKCNMVLFTLTPPAGILLIIFSSISLSDVKIYKANGLGSFLDRKSTRLNSSHVKISYAVFCLKKKN